MDCHLISISASLSGNKDAKDRFADDFLATTARTAGSTIVARCSVVPPCEIHTMTGFGFFGVVVVFLAAGADFFRGFFTLPETTVGVEVVFGFSLDGAAAATVVVDFFFLDFVLAVSLKMEVIGAPKAVVATVCRNGETGIFVFVFFFVAAVVFMGNFVVVIFFFFFFVAAGELNGNCSVFVGAFIFFVGVATFVFPAAGLDVVFVNFCCVPSSSCRLRFVTASLEPMDVKMV